MQEKQKLELICENQILLAQERLVDGENKLIVLNPTAEALIIEKRSLELAIRLAPTPAEKAGLTVQLMIVIAKMKALRAKQVLLVKTSEAQSLRSLLTLRREVKYETQRIKQMWDSSPLTPQVLFAPPRIKLIEVFKDPLLPIYKAPPQLPTLQTLRTEIRIRGSKLFPEWLSLLKSERWNWIETCSSHPKKGGLKWESFLGKGKSF